MICFGVFLKIKWLPKNTIFQGFITLSRSFSRYLESKYVRFFSNLNSKHIYRQVYLPSRLKQEPGIYFRNWIIEWTQELIMYFSWNVNVKYKYLFNRCYLVMTQTLIPESAMRPIFLTKYQATRKVRTIFCIVYYFELYSVNTI